MVPILVSSVSSIAETGKILRFTSLCPFLHLTNSPVLFRPTQVRARMCASDDVTCSLSFSSAPLIHTSVYARVCTRCFISPKALSFWSAPLVHTNVFVRACTQRLIVRAAALSLINLSLPGAFDLGRFLQRTEGRVFGVLVA